MDYRIEKFTGLSQNDDELLTSPCGAAEAVNVSTEGGALKRAAGYEKYSSAALSGGIGTLCAFYRRVNGQNDTRLLAVNALGVSEWTGSAWTTRCALAGSGNAAYLNYQKDGTDILLIADGVRPVLQWDGASAMAALPGCETLFSMLTLHYERVWGSGITLEPDAVYWSRAFDPEDWSGDEDNPDAGGGVVMIPTWNGGRIRALRALFNDVLVFKDEDLYRIVGTYPGNYEIVRVNGVVGPIAAGSVATDATACYFLSKEGLCAYDGVSARPFGQRAARKVLKNINPAYARVACAVIHKNRLYLAAPLGQSQVNNAVLEIDLTSGAHLLREGVNAACFLSYDDRLLFAGSDGYVYAYDAGDTLCGAAINALWRTPWTHAGSPDARKRFTALSMFARGRFTVTLETDECRVKRRVAAGDTLRPVTVPLCGAGRRFTLTVKNIDGSDFEIAPGLTVRMEMA